MARESITCYTLYVCMYIYIYIYICILYVYYIYLSLSLSLSLLLYYIYLSGGGGRATHQRMYGRTIVWCHSTLRGITQYDVMWCDMSKHYVGLVSAWSRVVIFTAKQIISQNDQFSKYTSGQMSPASGRLEPSKGVWNEHVQWFRDWRPSIWTFANWNYETRTVMFFPERQVLCAGSNSL